MSFSRYSFADKKIYCFDTEQSLFNKHTLHTAEAIKTTLFVSVFLVKTTACEPAFFLCKPKRFTDLFRQCRILVFRDNCDVAQTMTICQTKREQSSPTNPQNILHRNKNRYRHFEHLQSPSPFKSIDLYGAFSMCVFFFFIV